MPSILGQTLRFLGLLVELAGFCALAFRTGSDAAGAPLPGHYPPRLVWLVIGLGFALWLVGTLLNFLSRAAAGDRAARNGKNDLRL